MVLNRLPDVVLVRVLSFLSMEELEAIRVVCRKVEEFAKHQIIINLKQRSDWGLEYIQNDKFGKEISPFLVRRLFERSKCKKSTFTQRRTRIDEHGDVLTEVNFLLFCRVLTHFLERMYLHCRSRRAESYQYPSAISSARVINSRAVYSLFPLCCNL